MGDVALECHCKSPLLVVQVVMIDHLEPMGIFLRRQSDCSLSLSLCYCAQNSGSLCTIPTYLCSQVQVKLPDPHSRIPRATGNSVWLAYAEGADPLHVSCHCAEGLLLIDVPNLQRGVIRCRDKRAVEEWDTINDLPGMALQDAPGARAGGAGDIPDSHGAVMGRADDAGAVGVKPQPVDWAGVSFESSSALSTHDIPLLNGGVTRCRHKY